MVPPKNADSNPTNALSDEERGAINGPPLSYMPYFDNPWERKSQWVRQQMRRTAQQAARGTIARARRLANGKRYDVTIHHDLLTVRAVSISAGITRVHRASRVRGKVQSFSRKSRNRMMRFLASVRTEPQLFVTMTYPDDFPLDAPTKWAAHFEAFRRRFERLRDGWRCIWRMELKRRKSGKNIGMIAPHWHLLVWIDGADSADRDALAAYYDERLRAAWTEIAGGGDTWHATRYGCRVEPVRNRRHAYKYAAKYVGKGDDDGDGISAGRRWGRIGQFDTSPYGTISLTHDEYQEFRRYVRRWMAGKSRRYARALAQMRPHVGMSALGLGAASLPAFGNPWESTAWRIVEAVLSWEHAKRKRRGAWVTVRGISPENGP